MAENSTHDRREAAILMLQQLQGEGGALNAEQRQKVLDAFPELTSSDLIPLEAEAYWRSIR